VSGLTNQVHNFVVGVNCNTFSGLQSLHSLTFFFKNWTFPAPAGMPVHVAEDVVSAVELGTG